MRSIILSRLRASAQSDPGKLPPHVMAYFAMAPTWFADDDHEEAIVRLPQTLRGWGCWDEWWSVPMSGGFAQSRQRLGYEPVKEVFAQVAAPVADEDTPGALLGDHGTSHDSPPTPSLTRL
jgi:hypothetical protein